MNWSSHTIPCSLLLGLSLASFRAAAAESDDRAALTCRRCDRSYSVPFVRIAVMELGMYTAAAALWPDTYHPMTTEKNLAQLRRGFTDPPEYRAWANIFSSDDDWWYFNLLAHGLFGSEAYLAGRGWGHRPAVAGIYAAFASLTWEYLVEGWHKRPSAIDLFWTPLAGILFGELRYRAYLAVARGVSRRGARRALMIVLDPLGSFERRLLECQPR